MHAHPNSTPPSTPRLDLGSCELHFKADPKLVSVVRRFVSDFYERMLTDRDGIDRMALATHELLENAVKYSLTGETHLRIAITQSGQDIRVTITTRNHASTKNRAALQARVEEIAASKNPFELYQDVMRRSLLEGDGSRLGLARLRAEAEMQLSLDPSDEDEVSIRATTDVRQEEAS